MPLPIIRYKNVTKQFGDHIVLDNLNFDIHSGEIFGIIGSSGSGKTTMLNTMIGFLPVEKGDILFKQEQLLDFHETQEPFKSVFKESNDIKRTFGFASQNPSVYSKLTVTENLDYFGSLYGLGRSERKANITTLLSLMGLTKAANTLTENLSGGMRRRLDIACALMHDPRILILDEPTADLDPFLRKHVWKLLKKINKKGTTIVLSSHHLGEMDTLCTRVAIIHKSKMVALGTPNQLKDKYTKDEEIRLETFPGNYEKIVKRLNNKFISKIENNGTDLLIFTSRPEKVLKDALVVLGKLNEQLIDVKMSKPTLDEVFFSLSQKTKK